jgi:hypothetical protein
MVQTDTPLMKMFIAEIFVYRGNRNGSPTADAVEGLRLIPLNRHAKGVMQQAMVKTPGTNHVTDS